MTRLVKLLALLSALCFAALGVLSIGWLQPGGQLIFDSRIGGYSVTDARSYLDALSPAQTDLYLGPFRLLDTIFPVLLTLTLSGVIWLQTVGFSQPQRAFVALAPVVYLILDLAENARVALLLRTGPQVSQGAILEASAYTIGKWIALALAVMLVIWAWRLVPKGRAAP